jgi:hypothetical protein
VACSFDSHGGTWGDISLRPFRDGDAAALARFWEEREFDIPGGLREVSHIDRDFVMQIMGPKTLWTLLGFRADRVVASQVIRLIDQSVACICYVYVDPELRHGSFVPAFLLTPIQFLACLPPGSAPRTVAFYCPGNRSAPRLYERFGAVESRPGELQIVLPSILRVPSFARFAEWHGIMAGYRNLFRAISLNASGVIRRGSRNGCTEWFDWDGIRVLPQYLRAGNDWAEAFVDAESLEICHAACPGWSVSLLPATKTAETQESSGFIFQAGNTGADAIQVRYPLQPRPVELAPGERLTVEGRLQSQAGTTVHWPCKIAGNSLELGLHLPREAHAAAAEEVAAIRRNPGEGGLHTEGASARIDFSFGGSVSSLVLAGKEMLRSAEHTGSLGWIFPWKGGIFTLLEEGDCAFRLEPWGPFPGQQGFNTVPGVCDAAGACATRTGSTGPLTETTRFELGPDCLNIRCAVENRGARSTIGSLALFVFLANDWSERPAAASSVEGVRRAGSRRSFVVRSSQCATVESLRGHVALVLTEGSAEVSAFNLGDDGLHLMLVSSLSLQPGARAVVGATLQVEGVS